jgi:tRNA A58 N-methylase Trm61
MQEQLKTTASSWDSFKDTLFKVLEVIKPSTVFEYGPGVSTSIMSIYPTVDIIDTVEHDRSWYEKYKWEFPDNVRIMYQPILEIYPETKGRCDKYDLIFVDGREREQCLYIAKSRLKEGGVVILHDAERESYQELINTYKFKFWTDEGHTVTLTDNLTMSYRLGVALYD